MQTTPESEALLDELLERSAIVVELDGPQIEAWVSGLFALFDTDVTAPLLAERCAHTPSRASALLCHALAELTSGIDDNGANRAAEIAATLGAEASDVVAQIGTSVVSQGWTVQAPFGKSIVLGFDNPHAIASDNDLDEPQDLRHAILAEVDEHGSLVDLQLTGAAQSLVEEAAAAGEDRVVIDDIGADQAIELIVAAWPRGASTIAAAEAGPGLASNQQFVRRRIFKATEIVLPRLRIEAAVVDVRRGMSDTEYADANRAARSTLLAAVGLGDHDADGSQPAHHAWIGVIRGDGGDLSARERDALLWLEWADWLGVGIGLLRAGAGSPATGASFVDYVNRCPEVSSTIDKADRDYAEWAFEVAIDLLNDAGLIADGQLTETGHGALGPAIVAAWS